MKRLKKLITLVCSAMLATSCSAMDKHDNGDTVKSVDILKKIKKEKSVVINGKHISGALNLYEAGEGAKVQDIAPSYIDCEIIFVNCVFEDQVNGSARVKNGEQIVYTIFGRNVTFRQCIFTKDVDFTQCRFDEAVNFDLSTFKSPANMTAIYCPAGASFLKSKFELESSFVSAQFGKLANFVGTEFGYTTSFQSVRMDCDGIFIDAQIGGYFDMSSCKIYGELNFTNVVFASRVECIGTYFAGDVRMNKCRFNDRLTITGCTTLGKLQFYAAHFARRVTLEENTMLVAPLLEDVTKGEEFTLKKSGNILINK